MKHKRYIFDLESDGLLDTITKIWCMAIVDADSDDMPIGFRPTELHKALEKLDEADELIGHNIVEFDLPALEKVLGWKPRKEVIIHDTLASCRTLWANITDLDFKFARRMRSRGFTMPKEYVSKHSLGAWGWRLGDRKMHYDDWTKFTEEMLTYNIQDVVTNRTLLRKIESKGVPYDVLLLESRLHSEFRSMRLRGIGFDTASAAELTQEVFKETTTLAEELVATFPSTETQLKTKVKVIPFNPNSRQQISKQLLEWGWIPKVNTDGEPWHKGDTPKLDENVLKHDLIKISKQYPVINVLQTYFARKKLLSTIAGNENKAGTGWINMEVNGKLHGYVNHMGAVTARCSHNNPNLAQVPAHSEYGKRCRALFYAPGDSIDYTKRFKSNKIFCDDYILVGSDAAGLELRMLGHYMAKYDGGEYANIVVNGDIHTANQKAAGLPTRDNAKTFIYGFLYGAGPGKIGTIVGGSEKEGKALIDRFLKSMPALKKLRDAVQTAATRGYLIGLDGRHLPVRSKHSALNTLLQGGGAIVCKNWYDMVYREYEKKNLDAYIGLFVHDETQNVVHNDPITVGTAVNILQTSMIEVGTKLNLRIPLRADVKVGKTWAETH